MTLTATAAPSPRQDGRSSHVPLACFGNGRNQRLPRNHKATRPHDLFVPSKALEEFMKKKPEVSRPHTQDPARRHARRCGTQRGNKAGLAPHLTSLDSALI